MQIWHCLPCVFQFRAGHFPVTSGQPAASNTFFLNDSPLCFVRLSCRWNFVEGTCVHSIRSVRSHLPIVLPGVSHTIQYVQKKYDCRRFSTRKNWNRWHLYPSNSDQKHFTSYIIIFRGNVHGTQAMIIIVWQNTTTTKSEPERNRADVMSCLPKMLLTPAPFFPQHPPSLAAQQGPASNKLQRGSTAHQTSFYPYQRLVL